uniref:CCHC-type domain-containing protein n=1 Tax=Bracon brevicornis TaxID=1563983 RepID=A0A6V7L8A7_9HYME
MTEPGYEHILSMRRIVYILTDDVKKIPSKMEINFEGSRKMMFISEGQLKCFLCHEEGHRAKDCENSDSHLNRIIDENNSTIVTLERSNVNNIPEDSQTDQNINQVIPSPSFNRVFPPLRKPEVSTSPEAPMVEVGVKRPPSVSSLSTNDTQSDKLASPPKDPTD